MMTMLLAGHDTTALTLTYTWFLLSEHPEVEKRVHEELDEVIGDDRPGMEHVRELEYLEWVIQEAMRLYPPVYTMFRFAYFPFGGGPRHCIGKHLAMLEAQLIVATTAQQYRLEFLGETPLELLPSLTAHPRQEMSMRVVER